MANKKRLIDANALSEKILSLTLIVTGLRAGKGVLLELLTKFREGILQVVKEQPTVDAVEVVHGRWIVLYDDFAGKKVCCSNCHECFFLGRATSMESLRERQKYCFNCGAKMDGENDNGC